MLDHGVEVRSPGVRAVVDRARVAQIVENLVANAVRHGAPPVEVVVEDRGALVALIVSDAGAGIPEQRRPELFQRFSALAAGGGGHGLGLYIVRELARAHGGDVTYEAGAPGSRFVVTLPARRTSGLGRPEEAVTGVAEARDDVGVVVQAVVDGGGHEVGDEA